MVFLIQLKEDPNHLILVRATSRIDANNLAKVVDKLKRSWYLENYDETEMSAAVVRIGLK